MRISRRAGLFEGKEITIRRLIADINVICGGGTTNNNYMVLPENTNVSTPYYLFVSDGEAACIVKVNNTTVTHLTDFGTCTVSAINSGNFTYFTLPFGSKGASYLMFRFSNYSNVADDVLTSATLTRKAYRANTTKSTVQVSASNIDNNKLYFTFLCDMSSYIPDIYISLSSGSAILSTSAGNPISAWHNIWNSNTYTWEEISYAFAHKVEDNVLISKAQTGSGTSMYVGGIYELA